MASMSKNIPLFYEDMITYSCPSLNVGLANICFVKEAPNISIMGIWR